MKIWGTYDSPEALVIKSKMPQMLKLIEEAEQKLKEDLKMDDFELYDGDYEYEDGEYLDCEECEDYPDDC